MDKTVITLVSFFLGAVWALAWPRFVEWVDRIFMKKMPAQKAVQQDSLPPSIAAQAANIRFNQAEDRSESRAPSGPHRRAGIAELRKRAEDASRAPLDHQASVTQKNAKALESL